MSACRECGNPDETLLCSDGLCAYCNGAAGVRSMSLPDAALWELACDRSYDFWGRQGAYIVLKERGYDMPALLPVRGEPMPPCRLHVIDGGRP